MQQYGVQTKPLWNTEIEWTLPKNFGTDQEAAAWLARTYVVNLVAWHSTRILLCVG